MNLLYISFSFDLSFSRGNMPGLTTTVLFLCTGDLMYYMVDTKCSSIMNQLLVQNTPSFLFELLDPVSN
jgi:hypothetical protein